MDAQYGYCSSHIFYFTIFSSYVIKSKVKLCVFFFLSVFLPFMCWHCCYCFMLCCVSSNRFHSIKYIRSFAKSLNVLIDFNPKNFSSVNIYCICMDCILCTPLGISHNFQLLTVFFSCFSLSFFLFFLSGCLLVCLLPTLIVSFFSICHRFAMLLLQPKLNMVV